MLKSSILLSRAHTNAPGHTLSLAQKGREGGREGGLEWGRGQPSWAALTTQLVLQGQ